MLYLTLSCTCARDSSTFYCFRMDLCQWQFCQRLLGICVTRAYVSHLNIIDGHAPVMVFRILFQLLDAALEREVNMHIRFPILDKGYMKELFRQVDYLAPGTLLIPHRVLLEASGELTN